jgi:endonuclease/exonuclease/phosphatase family metal-dependent hydrolase
MVLVTSLAVGARSVVLYNVHLESRSGDDLRCAQLAELLHDTRQYDFEPQVLVAGDFNFDLTADPQNSVLQQAGFANPFGAVRLPMISEPSRHRHAIDWILVRADAKVSFPEIHKSVSGSDHYPLSLTLQLQ